MRTETIIIALMAFFTSISASAQDSGKASAANQRKEIKIAAHRGYWKKEGSYENTISSFANAAELGCDCSEFDVTLTKDSIPVIHHDPTIEGKKIEDTEFESIKDTKLRNGETLPTLDEFLKAALQYPEIRLVLELKPHSTPERDRLVTEKSVELVKRYSLLDRTDFISFSRTCCEEVHRLLPSSHVAYLNGDLSPREVKDMGLTGIDYHYSKFTKNPSWLKEAHDLGIEVNVWTVDDTKLLEELSSNPYVDIITTNNPDTLSRILGR